jgi:hypothetical protein
VPAARLAEAEKRGERGVCDERQVDQDQDTLSEMEAVLITILKDLIIDFVGKESFFTFE